MSAMKQLDQAIETVFELVQTKPGSDAIMDAMKQLGETYGLSLMSVMSLYNDWIMANNKRGV